MPRPDSPDLFTRRTHQQHTCVHVFGLTHARYCFSHTSCQRRSLPFLFFSKEQLVKETSFMFVVSRGEFVASQKIFFSYCIKSTTFLQDFYCCVRCPRKKEEAGNKFFHSKRSFLIIKNLAVWLVGWFFAYLLSFFLFLCLKVCM